MDTATTHPIAREYAGLAADDYPGNDDRPPLVLLHGLTFDRTIWAGIVAELRSIDPGRRVVAIDLPGHGRSPEQPSYDLSVGAEQLHQVVGEAQLDAPVVIGHSAGAILATVYASQYPSRGVVNVDQPLEVSAFAGFVRSLAPRLRGPEFPAVWEMFYDSFHTELLSPAARELVRSTCRPKQDVVLGYWRQIIEHPTEETVSLIDTTLAALDEKRVPYLYVCGEEPATEYRQWLGQRLPAATVDVWPATGHFPHLATPTRFAQRLAATGGWPTSSLA